MEIGTIELIDDEKGLLAQIKLDASALTDHNEARRNGEAVCALMNSLISRNTIPEHRMQFFTDPAYNKGGRGRSRLAIFEKNGTSGEEVFRHPHFLPYLRYFILGAHLPPDIARGFRSEVASCGPVTSGDIAPLCRFAKQQARAGRLQPRAAAEEFFKLGLDCGLSPDYAALIRDAVMKLR